MARASGYGMGGMGGGGYGGGMGGGMIRRDGRRLRQHGYGGAVWAAATRTAEWLAPYGGQGYGANSGTAVSGAAQSTPGLPAIRRQRPRPTAPGSYLGQAGAGGEQAANMPHVIPNPFDNTLLVQGTPQEWEQIQNLLRQLDVAPRQVLIDCKIYEVDLSEPIRGGRGERNCSAGNHLRDTGATRALARCPQAACR